MTDREQWISKPIDWGRVFNGRPFSGPPESQLFYPVRATGRYASAPPDEVDQDTGEVTKPSYWERRASVLEGSWWWPVEAHRRAERAEYWRAGGDEIRAAFLNDNRSGKD